MPKKLVYLFFFCVCASVFAQQQTLEELQQKYVDYFYLEREHVYLHLNKTVLAPKENIWFTAYSYDIKTNLPSAQTINLEVRVFDAMGKQVESKTIYIENGVGSGQFILHEEKYKPGKYFLKASTNYMKNFKEDLSFVQSFEILGDTSEKSKPASEVEYDLQFLPEGGHFVLDTENTIGLKLLDQNGKGTFFINAEVFNKKGERITSFKSNKFGISKFSITPIQKEEYTVKLKTEYGDTIEKKLPVAEEKGIILKTNNLLKDEVVFSIQTNKETYSQLKDKKFLLAFHQNEKFKGLNVEFSENKLVANVIVKRKDLFPGVNIITVFDQDYQPILERMIFNDLNLKRKTIKAQLKENLVDSLEIKLTKDPSLDSLQQLSISVLPKNTLAYNPKQNTLSAFYIKPYIKGNLEQGSYYFKNENKRRRNYDLDLLLLTQGWSKYEWNYIFNSTPNAFYENEVGFTLTGKVIKRNEKQQHQLFIKSEETGLFEVAEINKDDSFKIQNLFVVDSSSISIGLMNSKNDGVKNSSYTVSVLPFKEKESLKTNPEIEFRKKEEKKNELAKKIIPNDFISNAVSLDTVMLKGQSKTEREKRLEKLETAFGTVTIIDEDLERQYLFVTDFIRARGFLVNDNLGQLSISNRSIVGLNGPGAVTIILDGVPLGEDLSFLQTLYMSDLESIVINKTGLGFGVRGTGGVIKINSKTELRSSRKKADILFNAVLKNGFSAEKEFYAPEYSNYTSELFESYGVIDWQSNISLKNKSATFKIPNTLTKEIMLYIEGMSLDGYLISEEILIKP